MTKAQRKPAKRHKENPFIENMLIPVKGRQVQLSALGGQNNVLVDQSTGEVRGTHVTTFKQVDSQQFVKIFTANIALTFDLTSAGIKAFNVVMWSLQTQSISKDLLLLDTHTREDFIESTNKKLKLSQATFGRGLAELSKAQIIAKSMRLGIYYINPNFMFNGDRIAFTTLLEKKIDNQDQSRISLMD